MEQTSIPPVNCRVMTPQANTTKQPKSDISAALGLWNCLPKFSGQCTKMIYYIITTTYAKLKKLAILPTDFPDKQKKLAILATNFPAKIKYLISTSDAQQNNARTDVGNECGG